MRKLFALVITLLFLLSVTSASACVASVGGFDVEYIGEFSFSDMALCPNDFMDNLANAISASDFCSSTLSVASIHPVTGLIAKTICSGTDLVNILGGICSNEDTFSVYYIPAFNSFYFQ